MRPATNPLPVPAAPAPTATAAPARRARTARIPAQRRPGGRSTSVPPAAAAAPPSSLVKVATSARACCTVCGSRRLTQITMTLTDGTPVSFTSCRACEHRAWSAGPDLLPVESVLAKATKHR